MSHPEREPEELARFIMIGGFLGAGKTTAITRLAKYLADRGKRVGLICNDQSTGLVDTRLLRFAGFPVEEITGGCFCCRFDSLVEAADSLTREAAPDLFLAEPVGSCTDLIATVSYPLRRMYGSRFRVAPLSVLVDPMRAARILGLEEGRRFSEEVTYVYRKQLEEADLLVINKCDAHPRELVDRLASELGRSFPRAEIVRCSARQGTDVELWFETLLEPGVWNPEALEIDYDRYATGEARLGWLNCTVRLSSPALFDANRTLVELAREIRDRIAARDREISHLKMTLDSPDSAGTLSVVSVVRSDGEPDLREALLDRVEGGVLVINLRAESDPAFLGEVVRDSLASLESRIEGMRIRLEHLEELRPGRPEPTHRLSVGPPGGAT